MRRGHAFVVEEIAAMRQDGRNARVDLAIVQRRMPDAHPRHVRDQIAFAMFQVAKFQIVAAFNTHLFSPCFINVISAKYAVFCLLNIIYD